MKVPEEIRKVPRPKNTVVIATGSTGLRQYVVRARAGYQRSQKTGKLVPVNGPIIGFIFNGAFVEVNSEATRVRNFSFSMLIGYGAVRVIHDASRSFEASLRKVYDWRDVQTLMACIAIRILRPGLPLDRYRTLYVSSWVLVFWPEASVSANALYDFISKLGRQPELFELVFADRISSVASDHLVMIDGCLKQDSSIVNTLSQTSFKSVHKGHDEISLMYAYDFDLKELLCVSPYPGNTLDGSAFNSFVTQHKITRGVIVADKGFPVSQIRDLLDANPDLHYILPLKRNRKVIKSLRLLEYSQSLERSDRRVEANKCKFNDHLFYYAFRDLGKAAKERNNCFDRVQKGKLEYERYAKKIPNFGTIVFESDLDLPVESILENYDNRWELENIFDCCKSVLDQDRTQVQGDFSVIGLEFINFGVASISWKMAQSFNGLNKEHGFMSFEERIRLLYDGHRAADAPPMDANRNDGTWGAYHPQNSQAFDMMEQLGIMTPCTSYEVVAPNEKAGRPKSSRVKRSTERKPKPKTKTKVTEAKPKVNEAVEQPKRKPGRPEGSLNKATYERMAQEYEAKANGTYVWPKQQGAGRHKGQLSKKKLLQLAAECRARANGTYVEPPKPKRGRPKKKVEPDQSHQTVASEQDADLSPEQGAEPNQHSPDVDLSPEQGTEPNQHSPDVDLSPEQGTEPNQHNPDADQSPEQGAEPNQHNPDADLSPEQGTELGLKKPRLSSQWVSCTNAPMLNAMLYKLLRMGVP